MEPPNPSNLTGNDPITVSLRSFEDKNLTPQLQEYSKILGDVARLISGKLPPSENTIAGLRHLCAAKECFHQAAQPSQVK